MSQINGLDTHANSLICDDAPKQAGSGERKQPLCLMAGNTNFVLSSFGLDQEILRLVGRSEH